MSTKKTPLFDYKIPYIKQVMGKGTDGLEKWRQSLVLRRQGLQQVMLTRANIDAAAEELQELEATSKYWKAFHQLITRRKTNDE